MNKPHPIKNAVDNVLTGKPDSHVNEIHATDGVVLTRGCDIKPEPIRWLWKHWLAIGKFHLLAGQPGQGKTTLAMALIASLTSGGRWPDRSRCEPGSAVIWTGEDDPSDTLAPRLIAMGADMNRVYFVTGMRVNGEVCPFSPARDMATLAEKARSIGDVRLLLLDPVVSAVSGDGNTNTEVRRSLQPIVDLANEIGAVAIGITHLSKGTAGRDPTERVNGSIGFTAVARVVMLAAKLKDDDGKQKRILIRSKSNVGPDDGGFEYFIEQVEALPGIEASSIQWGQAIDGTARELLAEAEQEKPADDAGTNDADDALKRILSRDMVPSKQAEDLMKEAGFTPKQTRNARLRLNVDIKRTGFGGETKSYWKLPNSVVLPEDDATGDTDQNSQLCPLVPTHAHKNSGQNWAELGTSGETAFIEDAKYSQLGDKS